METLQKNKKVFLFVGIFAVVVLVYELFFSGGSAAPKNSLTDPTAGGLVSELSISPADAIIGQQLLVVLSQLRSITLDTSVFTNKVFISFQDKSKPIALQPLGKSLGRRNPFSDFNKNAGTATTSSATR